MGILFAVTALFAWGLADFLIQRSARKFGDWLALFYVTAFASIVLLPFAYHELALAYTQNALLLWGVSIMICIASLCDFEALREGKISVVEPIYAMEIPVTAILASLVIGEHLTALQTILVVSSIFGIFLVSTKRLDHFAHMRMERGVWFAILATAGMGISNFLFGVGSRELSPLVIVLFTSLFMATITFLYLLWNGRTGEIMRDLRRHKRLIVNVGFFDTIAWVSFSYACLYIPIAVATSVSEAYILLASALGLVFNKEKLKFHQYVGFVVAVASVIILAMITK